MPGLIYVPVTIAAGSSLSSSARVDEGTVVAIVMPSAWDAANITFQASQDGTNWLNVHNEAGDEVTATAAAGRYIVLMADAADQVVLSSMRYLRLRSGTSALPVNQTAERVITLVIRPSAT